MRKDNLEEQAIRKSYRIPGDWIWDEGFRAYKIPSAPKCEEDGWKMFFNQVTQTFFCPVCKEEMTKEDWENDQMKGYL